MTFRKGSPIPEDHTELIQRVAGWLGIWAPTQCEECSDRAEPGTRFGGFRCEDCHGTGVTPLPDLDANFAFTAIDALCEKTEIYLIEIRRNFGGEWTVSFVPNRPTRSVNTCVFSGTDMDRTIAILKGIDSLKGWTCAPSAAVLPD